MLFAEEVTTPTGISVALVGAVVTLVTTIAWFLRHLVVTTFPGMIDTFTKELAAERGARLVQHQDNREDHAKLLHALLDVHKGILDRIEKEAEETRRQLQETRHSVKNNTTTLAMLINSLKKQGKVDDGGVK